MASGSAPGGEVIDLSLQLEGFLDDDTVDNSNNMQLFIVPPDPPRGRQKRPVNRGQRSADDEPEGSNQRRRHTIDLDGDADGAAPDAAAAAADAAADGAQQPNAQPGAKEPTPRALKSAAWKNFTKLIVDGADVMKAQCNLCNNILSSASKNGTSHLLRHLLTQHKSTQAAIGNFFLKSEQIDILDFWSKSAARYPELARMARDMLAVPVSSVASESAFSLSKKVVTPNRSSLKPQTVEALMCVQDWFRCKMQLAEDKSKEAGASHAATLEKEDSSSDEE